MPTKQGSGFGVALLFRALGASDARMSLECLHCKISLLVVSREYLEGQGDLSKQVNNGDK